MSKFRKKPIVVEATQWFKNGDHPAVQRFATSTPIICDDPFTLGEPTGWQYYINTLEGPLKVSPGDWIITGVKGEMYPVKDEIFRETYEAAAPSPPEREK